MKILLKMPNWVGDIVMATPAVARLRAAFPSAELDTMVRPGIAAVLQDNPDVTRVLAMEDRKLPIESRRQLRENGYDAAVLFPNSLGSAWMAWSLRIPRRIGYARGGRSLLLTDRIKFRPEDWRTRTPKPLTNKSILGPRELPGEPLPGHMVLYYNQIAERTIQALGGTPTPAGQASELVLPVNAVSAQKIDALLESRGLSGVRLVGLNPGAASGGAKRWPLARLGAVADSLAGLGYGIIAIGIKSDAALNAELQRNAKVPVHALGEEVDLPGMVALIDRLSLIITNDSGAMHMAAARGIPTVAMFGPTDWNVTFPWQKQATIVRQSPDCSPCLLRECPIDHRCMNVIEADHVIVAAKQMLDALEK